MTRPNSYRSREASLLTGLGAPRNTPVDIIAVINKETNSALADPKIKAQLKTLGNTVLPGSPADFGALIAEETDKSGHGGRMSGGKAWPGCPLSPKRT